MKHTPGAIRAAAVIMKDVIGWRAKQTESQIATIIEEETGLAELLEAAKVLECLNSIRSDPSVYKMLCLAIARAEKGTP